jgi:hypothetical protein
MQGRRRIADGSVGGDATMTSIGSVGSAIAAQRQRAEVRDAESRAESAARDEERAARRREDAESDRDRAERSSSRVDRYA